MAGAEGIPCREGTAGGSVSKDEARGVRTLDVKSAVISCGDSFNIVRTSFYSLNRSRPWKQVEGGF